MKSVGGNNSLAFQVKTTAKNEIGEAVPIWKTIQTINGWLDLSSGDSKYNNYNAKIEESTHIFIGDYVELDPKITAEKSRAIVNGKTYDVMLIDNPMELNYHWEIYLKYTGGQ